MTFNFDSVSHIFWEMHEAAGRHFIGGCGSYLFDGGAVFEYDVRTAPKQQLLARVASEVGSALEIGTYLGHSLLIMLAANPQLRVTTIDLDNTYAAPAVDVLKRHFPKAQIDFRHGHSLNVLPQITETYDLFHIDGTHEPHQIAKEWKALLTRRSTDLVKVVIDDVDADSIWGVVDQIKAGGRVVEEEVPDCRWRNAYYAVRVN
jgi:hypothetical protein